MKYIRYCLNVKPASACFVLWISFHFVSFRKSVSIENCIAIVHFWYFRLFYIFFFVHLFIADNILLVNSYIKNMKFSLLLFSYSVFNVPADHIFKIFIFNAAFLFLFSIRWNICIKWNSSLRLKRKLPSLSVFKMQSILSRYE